MRFADVIGHDGLKARLRRGVDEGRIAHAQLLAGDCGYGILPLALAYVQYLNCTDRRGGDSCGVCPSCVKTASLAHPDVHFVFPVNGGGSTKPLSDDFLPQWREEVASTGGYFDERMWYDRLGLENQQGIITKREADEVIRKLSFKSYEGGYKSVVVWLPERMGAEAANGLLKILEEPWERTLFILVSAEPQALLPTILSRVQCTMVPPVDAATLEAMPEAGGESDRARIAAMAATAGGSVIGFRRLLAAGGDGGEDFERFVSLMRLSYNDRHIELLDWADRMAAAGREAQKRFLRYTAAMLRESYVMAAGMENISYLWGEEREFCRKFSPFIGNHNIERLVAETSSALSHIAQNGNPRIVFAHYALSVSKLIVKMPPK